MKIGLMGFEFKSANKGCEALVYSFLSIVEENLGEDGIIYNFTGTELGFVPEHFPNLTFVNVLPKLKDFSFNYIKQLKKCDFVFDVTMGDSFSDIYSESYYNSLIMHKMISEFLCKKYILLPQTYGPFYSKKSENKARKVFKRAYRIYCRDEMSQKLLKEKFGIDNSMLSSDMAFVLPYEKEMFQFSSKDKVGINISGLLYKGGFHSKNQFGLTLDYPQLIDKLITNLSNQYEVHLIPHVIDQSIDAYDDDYKICKKLNKKYPDTVLAPAFETPIQAKSYISNMEIFIGSRMHSTIAAFSSNVITIPISYSRKFEGLFGSLNYPYVVNAKENDTASAFKLVMDYINKKGELKEKQLKSLDVIDEKNKKFKESILELLNGGRR